MSKREQIDSILKEFQDATGAYYGSQSYASGYLGAMLVGMLLEEPAEERELKLRQLAESAAAFRRMKLIDTIKDAA